MTNKTDTLLDVSAAIVDGLSPEFLLPLTKAVFYLDVTAVSGTTPTLDVDIEVKDLETDKWYVLASFAQAVAITKERKEIPWFPEDDMRVNYAITGTTPSFDFTVTRLFVVE